jgi:hypothetical protein
MPGELLGRRLLLGQVLQRESAGDVEGLAPRGSGRVGRGPQPQESAKPWTRAERSGAGLPPSQRARAAGATSTRPSIAPSRSSPHSASAAVAWSASAEPAAAAWTGSWGCPRTAAPMTSQMATPADHRLAAQTPPAKQPHRRALERLPALSIRLGEMGRRSAANVSSATCRLPIGPWPSTSNDSLLRNTPSRPRRPGARPGGRAAREAGHREDRA